jgi:hypothetical protein
MKILISTKSGVQIMTLLAPVETLGETLEKWKSANPNEEYLSHREIEDGEVPTDRTFRNAWEDTGTISVNMPKARESHKDRIRAARAPLLAALDTEYMRADEAGDAEKKAAIAAEKQALRDATKDPAIDAAKTPEDLKAVIPDAITTKDELKQEK